MHMLPWLLKSKHWERMCLKVHCLRDTLGRDPAWTGIDAIADTWLPNHVLMTYGWMNQLEQDCHKFGENPEVLARRLGVEGKLEWMQSVETECVVCWELVDVSDARSFMMCRSRACDMAAHVTCLAQWFLYAEFGSEQAQFELYPRFGTCPSCRIHLSWGDLVQSVQLHQHIKGQLVEATEVDDATDESSGNERERDTVDALADEIETLDI